MHYCRRQLLYAHVIPVRYHALEESLNLFFHLLVGAESASCQKEMLPLLRLLSRLWWSEMPRFISCYNWDQKVFIVCTAANKLAWIINTLPLVVFFQYLWNPSSVILPILNFSVKILFMLLRDTSGTKMQRSSRVIRDLQAMFLGSYRLSCFKLTVSHSFAHHVFNTDWL